MNDNNYEKQQLEQQAPTQEPAEPTAEERAAKAKKSDKRSGVRFYKKTGFKYSAAATALSVLFIVCIVAVNILATFVAQRVSFFDFDLTASQDFSISADNLEYIKKIDRPVTITMTCTEDYYIGDYYNYVSQYYVDTTSGRYFEQTVQLLHEYAKQNSNITLQFIDSDTPAFSATATKYSSEYFEPGMLLVECSFTNSAGSQQDKYRLLELTDLYEITSDSSETSYYGTSYITGSSLESAVTSALYYVTAEQQDKATIITGYGCNEISDFRTTLEKNNYDFEELETLAMSDIPEDTDLLILAAPTVDLTEAEIRKLDNFLLESGYGKNLLYFADAGQPELPNLERLLREWGFTFGEGIVYETDENRFAPGYPTIMYLDDAESDYTEGFNVSSRFFVGEEMRPMTIDLEQSGQHYKTAILNSATSSTVMPIGAESSWSPAANAEHQSYNALGISTYATSDPDDSATALTSNIIAASSVEFIAGQLSAASTVLNSDLLLSVINTSVGRQSDSYVVQNKVINSSTFTTSATPANAVYYICVFIIPLLVIATGVVIYVRRKRR